MNEIVPEFVSISRESIYVLLDEKYILAGKDTVSQTRLPRFNSKIKELNESIKNLFNSTSSYSLSFNSKSREFSRKSSNKLPKASSASAKKKLDASQIVVVKTYLEKMQKTIQDSLATTLPNDWQASEKQIRERLGPKEEKFLDSFFQTQTFAFSLQSLDNNNQ